MFALLTTEHSLLKGSLEKKNLKKLIYIDAAYAISAVLVLVFGLGLWFWVGKPTGFYNDNWIFHTKVTLFVLVGILSIVPTRFLLKNRKAERADVPKPVVIAVRIELLLLCIIPLLAVLMANGVGYTH